MTEDSRAPDAGAVASRRLVVLHSLAPPDGTTRYVDQVVGGAPDDVDVRCFSWGAAFRGGYDVLHLHWPELLVRARSPLRRFGKRQAMRMLLLRCRALRIPIVRTVHNVRPHEAGSAAERTLLDAVDRRTDLFVRLNPATDLPPGRPSATIPHGHYRDRFAAHPRSGPVPGRILYAGIIRPYKGVERLLAAYRDVAPLGTGLRLVGNPTPELRGRIEAAVADDARVTARLAFVPDDELVREVTAADLVVLPYSEMHNSGILLVALSLGRRVLVPRTPTNDAIADEVGDAWVLRYDGDFDGDALRIGLAAIAEGAPAGEPELAGRDWPEVGRRHAAAYRMLLTDRGTMGRDATGRDTTGRDASGRAERPPAAPAGEPARA